MNDKPHIAILMATYNGSRYIREQIDSLLNQTEKGWTLYVHDDGSNDDTVSIVDGYAGKHVGIVRLDYEPQHGATANFLSLMQRVEADYYLFCDQDDVWMPTKVADEYAEMRRLEAEGARPIVVCTDLLVTDERLNVTNESFNRLSGIYPQYIKTFNQCAATTAATGCTMMFNRLARDSALSHANVATMHDSIVVCSALKAGGTLHCIPVGTVYYRQHGCNTIGASDIRRMTIGYRLRHIKVHCKENLRHYRMLRALGYGSPLLYIYNKVAYKIRTRENK